MLDVGLCDNWWKGHPYCAPFGSRPLDFFRGRIWNPWDMKRRGKFEALRAGTRFQGIPAAHIITREQLYKQRVAERKRRFQNILSPKLKRTIEGPGLLDIYYDTKYGSVPYARDVRFTGSPQLQRLTKGPGPEPTHVWETGDGGGCEWWS